MGSISAALVPTSVPNSFYRLGQTATGASENSRPGDIENPEDGLIHNVIGGYGKT